MVTLALLLGVLLLSGLPSFTAAQSDAEYFEQVVNGDLSAPLLAGPYDFVLEQRPNVLSVFRAGLDVPDFVAHAAFTNPTDDNETPWDYGFQFRTTGDNEDMRIFVVSDGTWNFAVGTEVPEQTVVAANLDTAPGAVNTLDLIVEGFQAIFGINGEFAGVLSLPDLRPSGDVYASTGFYGDYAVPGRTIELSGFTVYGLPGTPGPPSAPAIVQDNQNVPPRPVTLYSGSCGNLGGAILQLREATYPVGDPVGQESSVVAETSFTRIPNLLEDLLQEPTAISVAQSFDAPDVSIACGDIGGIADEIGGYVIGLQEQNGSGYRGVAYLGEDAERGGSNVSVFLVPGPAAPQSVTQAPSPDEGTPVPVATPVAAVQVDAPATATPTATEGAMIIVIEDATPTAAVGASPAVTPAG
jgi:hypothetical protein